MQQIKDQPIRWDIWNIIFISLTVFKRDKLEEVEASLMSLYYEFAVQLQDADYNDLLKVTKSMMTSEKLMSYVNGCKVRKGFVFSSTFCIFAQFSVRGVKHHCDDHQVGTVVSEIWRLHQLQ